MLTGLIEDKARIRRLADQSGLITAQINPDGAATEYWWRVLVEAHRRRKVDKIVAGVGGEIEERKGELEEAYRLYAGAAGDVDETQPAPTKTPISPVHSDYLYSLFDRWGAVRLADILDKLDRQVRLLDVYVPLPIDARIRMEGTENNVTWWFDRGGQEVGSGMTRQMREHADRENRPRTWPELGINDPAQLEPLVRHLWDKNERQRSDKVSVLLDAEHAAALQSRLVLLGGPGSGKSSFLRHLTLCLAGAMLHAAGEMPPDPAAGLKLLPGWSAGAYTPIYIELRDLVKLFPELPDHGNEEPVTLPGIEVFWTYLRQKENSEGVVPELHRLLRQGRIMVLLDGLDEVNRAHEPARMRQIVALVDALHAAKAARILIASRTHAYQTANAERLP
ncbi:MAG: NACHT domain-containing protein, partial [Caldilinea sp.]